MKMAKSDRKAVDKYIAAQPKAVQSRLTRVRSTIRKAVPGAEETIWYGIPTFKQHGRPVIYFAGWSQHYSIYPSSDRLVAAFKDALDAVHDQQGHDPLPALRARARQTDRAHREVPRQGSRSQEVSLTAGAPGWLSDRDASPGAATSRHVGRTSP